MKTWEFSSFSMGWIGKLPNYPWKTLILRLFKKVPSFSQNCQENSQLLAFHVFLVGPKWFPKQLSLFPDSKVVLKWLNKVVDKMKSVALWCLQSKDIRLTIFFITWKLRIHVFLVHLSQLSKDLLNCFPWNFHCYLDVTQKYWVFTTRKHKMEKLHFTA